MRKRSLFILVLIAILLPVAVYLRVWDYYAVNIAKWDDHVLKKTLLDAINAHGWTDYISILSVQHNEHRIFLTRLVALLDFSYFRSEEHTSELQSRENLVCRLLL